MKTVYFILSTVCFAFFLGLLAVNNVIIYPIVRALGKLVRVFNLVFRYTPAVINALEKERNKSCVQK